MSQFVNAVQVGDEIVLVSKTGGTTRRIKGLLISFSDGRLVYKNGSSTTTVSV